MSIGDFFSRLGGRTEPEPAVETPRAPNADDLRTALDRAEMLVDGGAAPSVVAARVRRVTATVRDTIPRLEVVGLGSDQGYSVMATATDYLPEAVNGYLRLPRRFADTRPVDGDRTSLMLLVDQLDLLGATMDRVFDAVCRDDATALVAHARFLDDKFGHGSSGGGLELAADAPVPQMPESPGGADSSRVGPTGAGSDGADSDGAHSGGVHSGVADRSVPGSGGADSGRSDADDSGLRPLTPPSS